MCLQPAFGSLISILTSSSISRCLLCTQASTIPGHAMFQVQVPELSECLSPLVSKLWRVPRSQGAEGAALTSPGPGVGVGLAVWEPGGSGPAGGTWLQRPARWPEPGGCLPPVTSVPGGMVAPQALKPALNVHLGFRRTFHEVTGNAAHFAVSSAPQGSGPDAWELFPQQALRPQRALSGAHGEPQF